MEAAAYLPRIESPHSEVLTMFRDLKFWRWPLPLTFLVLYLGVIFGFARANHLTTIEHEASMRVDATEIKAQVAASMIASYKESRDGAANRGDYRSRPLIAIE
jgi:hypothetical protein